MMKNIDLQRLYQLSIYELRNLARTMGIPRPTTMLRIELIEGIIERTQSENFSMDQTQTSSGIKQRGRPPRVQNVSIESIIDPQPIQTFGIAQILEQMQCTDISNCVRGKDTNACELKDVNGFAYVVPRGTGLLICPSMTTYHIPLKFIAEHKIATGDYIVGKSQDINMTEITSVKNTNFDTVKIIRPHKTRKIDKAEIKLGNRVIIQSKQKIDFVEYIANAQVAFGDLHTVALLIDENVDSADFIKEKGISEVYLCRVEFDKKTRLLYALSALLVAKQHASQGKDVVLFIDNLNKLLRVYNAIGTDTDGYLTDLKTFFMQSRQILDGGSLTIITSARESNTEGEKFVLDGFLDMANSIWTI